MDNKNKTYTNLSIAGILFLMTGYLLEKIIKIEMEIIPMACYMISIILLLTSILKSNKLKKQEKEDRQNRNLNK
ncbi:MAG: hypothetical protein ACLSAJ_00635 [Intestinibacter bartlettii]|uniref:Uncharacterized protein n=2 Tax=Bacillota TaxID=1239 RepID=A0A6N2ZMQ7_9FIRM|nr:hypothetical protein [Negativicoccus succinicivorans]ETI89959.1 MAG: hypothetical protein Q612_NSC00070G0001 [Negativicoccus succinicivorans DORA_17_25]